MNTSNFHKELKPYMKEPPAMESGAIGKHGKLALTFTLDSQSGKSYLSKWSRQAPLIVQQELYFDEKMATMPCVYILSSGGPNVDGDRYEIELNIEKDAFAHISTGAATKIAEMRYNHASNHQSITIDENGYLEYIPLPIIPCKNSRYLNETTITIHPTATLFYSEIYCAGREYYDGGEIFKYDLLSITSKLLDPQKKMLFREKMIIEPYKSNPSIMVLMGNYKHFADIIIATPEEHINAIIKKHSPFRNKKMALGVNILPNNCGINIKLLGNSVEELKRYTRSICSTLRKEIKGRELPEEFAWR